MSDLAPFVAAVLRDKVVEELQEELHAEKAKNKKLENELRTIRVTGPGGFPVYAERHFQYADFDDDFEDEEPWSLLLQTPHAVFPDGPVNPNLPTCQVQDIEKCELHIGGKEIIRIGDCDNWYPISTNTEENIALLYVFQPLQDEPEEYEFHLLVEFGPNPDRVNGVRHIRPLEEYRNLGVNRAAFPTFLSKHHPFQPEED